MSSTTTILNYIVIVFISHSCTLHAFTLPPAPIIGSNSPNILNSQVGKTAALPSFAPLNHGPTRRQFHPSLSLHFQNMRDDTQMSSLPDSSDPYIILNLSRRATKGDVKKAYRKRALQYHPDIRINTSSTEEERQRANEDFARINAAYATLKKKANSQINIKRANTRTSGAYPKRTTNGSTGSNTHVNTSGVSPGYSRGGRGGTNSAYKQQVNKSSVRSKGYGGTTSPYVRSKRVSTPIVNNRGVTSTNANAKSATTFKPSVSPKQSVHGVTGDNVPVNKSRVRTSNSQVGRGRRSGAYKSSSKGYGGTSSPYLRSKRVSTPIVTESTVIGKSEVIPKQTGHSDASNNVHINKLGVTSGYSVSPPSSKGYGGTSSPYMKTRQASQEGSTVLPQGIGETSNPSTYAQKECKAGEGSKSLRKGYGGSNSAYVPGTKHSYGGTSSAYVQGAGQPIVGTSSSKGYTGTSNANGRGAVISRNSKSNQVHGVDRERASRPAPRKSSVKEQKNWGDFFDSKSFHSQWNTDSQHPTITKGVQTIYESEESFKNSYTGYGGTSSEDAEGSYQPQISNVGSSKSTRSKSKRPSIQEQRRTGDFFDADRFHSLWNPSTDDDIEKHKSDSLQRYTNSNKSERNNANGEEDVRSETEIKNPRFFCEEVIADLKEEVDRVNDSTNDANSICVHNSTYMKSPKLKP